MITPRFPGSPPAGGRDVAGFGSLSALDFHACPSNYWVHVGGRDRCIDLAWPDQKVAAEFDGFVPHSSRRVFDDDRVRQNDLVDNDWLPYRLTKTALEADARRAFDPIARAVAKRLRNGTLTL
jgi:hypothetical protein